MQTVQPTAQQQLSGTKDISYEEPPAHLPRAQLAENQRKVITDKYLRTAPSIESWLWNIAKNIALAETLNLQDVSREKLFDGVHYTTKSLSAGQGQTTELLLFHKGLYEHNERDINHKRFLMNAQQFDQHPVVRKTAEAFYTLMALFDFLPNSPTLMNAGRSLQQLSACFVLPVDDSIEGWGDVLKQTMIIHQSGGGTGFSGCRIRPAGDRVRSTNGVASGALSPFFMIDATTQCIKQGGTRRGANMGILPYWHPDIFSFINAKAENNRLENFNISVAADADFFRAVKENGEFEIRHPATKQIMKKVAAKEMFNLICTNAWKSGDPGVIFIDRINESLSNPTPHIGQIESTNPCGEQPLLPYEPCNLGSINLSRFVENGVINWQRLRQITYLAVRFLDNVIDVNNYPIYEIEEIAKANRRIGLGVMGWAEMLVKLGISYDSEEALEKAAEVMKFINDHSLAASEELSIPRGVFPNFRNSVYDESGQNSRPWAKGRPRNCARTTIAPTGTIAIAAGLQGSGIEPFFSIAYTRYNAKALDALKKGETPNPADVFWEVNPLFKDVAVKNNFFGLPEAELWRKIADNHASVRGIAEIPVGIQRVFVSAHDVSVEYHVKHQAAFQRYVDNGVSKTINLPNSATVEDISKTYLMAWETGCKGITVYRDGCKSHQVLNLGTQTGAQTTKTHAAQSVQKKRDFSTGVTSMYYKFDTGYGPVHVHIDHDNGVPFRVFTNTTPVGTEVSGLTSALGVMISKYLDSGGDINEVRKQLNSIKSDKVVGFGPNRIESIPHAISVALTKFLQQQGKEETQKTLPKEMLVQKPAQKQEKARDGVMGVMAKEADASEKRAEHCPKCYSPNIAYLAGCHGPTCFDCGHAECS